MPIHLIQFPGRAEYGRAITVLGEVPRTRVGLPDFKMVVEKEHVHALNRSGIPYTDLTKGNGHEPPAPIQP